jgi:hypothetical protein
MWPVLVCSSPEFFINFTSRVRGMEPRSPYEDDCLVGCCLVQSDGYWPSIKGDRADDWGSMFIWDVGHFIAEYTAQHPTRQQSSALVLNNGPRWRGCSVVRDPKPGTNWTPQLIFPRGRSPYRRPNEPQSRSGHNSSEDKNRTRIMQAMS